MKRHVQQKNEIRKWYGDHLTELQSESLSAIDAIASHFGTCVLQGCTIYDVSDSSFRMSDGILSLICEDGVARTVRYNDTNVVPYSVQYLNGVKTDVIGEYENPSNTVIAEDWAAVFSETGTSDKGLFLGDLSIDNLPNIKRLSYKIKEYLDIESIMPFKNSLSSNMNALNDEMVILEGNIYELVEISNDLDERVSDNSGEITQLSNNLNNLDAYCSEALIQDHSDKIIDIVGNSDYILDMIDDRMSDFFSDNFSDYLSDHMDYIMDYIMDYRIDYIKDYIMGYVIDEIDYRIDKALNPA